jgi:hypothetical protein
MPIRTIFAPVTRAMQFVFRADCPRCETRTPVLRAPTSTRQALLGGWTCEACGCEMDRTGREIAPPASAAS